MAITPASMYIVSYQYYFDLLNFSVDIEFKLVVLMVASTVRMNAMISN